MAFINTKHPDGLSAAAWTDVQVDSWVDTTWKYIEPGIGINSNGNIFTWGGNSYGEVGNQTTTVQISPTQIGSDTWLSAHAFGHTRAAIRQDGTLWAWGLNNYGQLGDGTTIDKSSPVQIGTDSWTAIVMEYTARAIKSDGTLWAWGYGDNGQLGDGTTVSKSSPVQIGTSSWTAVDIEGATTVAIRSDGALFTWGLNTNGQLGNNDTSSKSSPVQIGTSSWIAVSAGVGYITAIRSDGTLWAWGRNQYGQLGDGTTINKSSPVQIGSSSWTAVGNSKYMAPVTAAIRSDGQLFTWGYGRTVNIYPGFGDGITAHRSSPVAIGGALKWITITGGVSGFIGTLQDGRAYAWGQYSGFFIRELAIPSSSDTPREIITTASGISRETFVAKRSDSTLWTWGDNTYGQLGDGTTISSTQGTTSSPVQIGTSSWISVSAHRGTMLAVLSDGGLWRWGRKNSYLDPTDVDRSSPTLAYAGPWSAVHIGAQHAALISSAGYVYTWGHNDHGQLGDGTTVSKSSPVLVLSSPVSKVRAVQIAPGNSKSVIAGGQTFALGSTGVLWGWGVGTTDGTTSYIGDGTTISRSSPVQVSGTWLDFESQNSTATNYNHMGVKSDFSLNSWPGTSSTSYVPYGFSTTSFKFVKAPQPRSGSTYLGFDAYSRLVAITPATALAVANTSFTNVGSVITRSYDAGYTDPLYDSVVIKSSADTQTPNAVAIPYNFGTSSIVSGGSHSYLQESYSPVVLTSRYYSHNDLRSMYRGNVDRMWAVGSNLNGALGDVTTVNRSYPVRVAGGGMFATASVGQYNAHAIRYNGELWGWGDNSSGQLGDGTTVSKSSPTQIGSSSWTAVSSGLDHAVAIRIDGALFAWGRNLDAELGDGTTVNKSSPVQIGSSSWTAVSTNYGHTLAIRSDGALFAWGENFYGQLGDGTTIDKSSPVQIGSSSWIAVSVNIRNSAAIRSDGTLWVWGDNAYGSLGIETTGIDKSSPVQVGTSSWIAVSVADYGAHAIRSDGTLWGWGDGADGRLGDGTTIDKSSPVQIGTSTWAQISSDGSHAMAVRSDGTIWGWGYNGNRQLGLGSLSYTTSPIALSLTRARHISTRTWSSVFITD